MALAKKTNKTRKELYEERRAAALANPPKKRRKSRKKRAAEKAEKNLSLTERPNNMIVVTMNEMRITHAYGNANRQPFETEAGAQRAAARLEKEHPETEFHIVPLRQAPYMTSRKDEY